MSSRLGGIGRGVPGRILGVGADAADRSRRARVIGQRVIGRVQHHFCHCLPAHLMAVVEQMTCADGSEQQASSRPPTKMVLTCNWAVRQLLAVELRTMRVE
jgi:hypothetical protein